MIRHLDIGKQAMHPA